MLDAVLARAPAPRPRPSPSLLLAARELARRAAGGDRDPLARARIRAALAHAAAIDAAPVGHLVEADAAALPGAVAQAVRTAPGTTHAAVGIELRGERGFAVVLLSRRPVALAPFPREVERGAHPALRGDLLGIDDPSVHVTSPGGESRELRAAVRGRSFQTDVPFDAPGRWLVEVMGRGRGGPEVAALLAVSCAAGPAALEPPADDEREPADLGASEARVVAELNAARARRGVAPLAPSPALAALARRHSEAMLAARTLAHVLPGSGDVVDRLRRARVAFRVVRENVAKGRTALAAHRAAEDSPAHRENMLATDVSLVGCGAARGVLAGGDPIVYLTEIFAAPPPDRSADRISPEGRVREAIWRERERRRAPPLLSDPTLDDLAREAAREMLERGAPAGEELGQRALALGRSSAAVDAFVAPDPAAATRSSHLPEARYRRVGVGVVEGDHPRYGAALLFIAVVYTE